MSSASSAVSARTTGSLVRNDLDEALGFELAQGLANNGPRDAEALGELALGQALTRAKLPRYDSVAQTLDHLLAQ